MKLLRAWAIRLSGLFGKQRREADLAAEIESHIDLHVADNLRAGMSPDEARRAALLQLGSPESAKEAYRERSTAPALEHLFLDLRFALRQLSKNPSFGLTAVLVLALGICACLGIFAFVDAALLKPLPYPDPTRLVAVYETAVLFPRADISWLDYVDWNRSNKVFRSFDVFHPYGFLLQTATGTQPVSAGRVSSGFFRTLGVVPVFGRDFLPSEGIPGSHKAVMLTYGAWQQYFGSRPEAIGQNATLSGQTYTVVGVLPRDFHFAPLGKAALWTIVDTRKECESRRSCHDLDGIARLKDGISVDAARANMAAIAKTLERQYPDSNRGQGAAVIPATEAFVGNLRPILLVLMGGAALLLLIAYVNVASLILVHSERRRREMAVRSALGASVSRLLSQFVAEGALLVLAATALGLLFATWLTDALKGLIPADMAASMPFFLDMRLTWRELAAAGLIAIVALALFFIAPAFHLFLSEIGAGLNQGSRGSSGAAWRRLGSRLVAVEIAIAMVLLAGAGLFAKSLYSLLHVEVGFQPEHLALLNVQAPEPNYPTDDRTISLGRQVVRQVSQLPGIQSVALADVPPLSFNGNTSWIRFVGRPYDGRHNEVNSRSVSANYFQTIRAKLVRGRYFSDAEDESKPNVVIINQTLANKYFPGEDPMGHQFGDTDLKPKSIKTIIGVVENIREGSPDEDIWPAEYHPFNQDPNSEFSVIVRSGQSSDSVLPGLTASIHKLHHDLGTDNETTMQRKWDDSNAAWLHRSSAYLVGGFAFTALLLGVIGLYSVIAYSVSQRTREIGVRIALGAEQVSVYWMVLKEAGWLAAAGIGAGSVLAILGATLARDLLFGVTAWDFPLLLAVGLILGAAAALASLIPARRAASVNPVEALRAE